MSTSQTTAVIAGTDLQGDEALAAGNHCVQFYEDDDFLVAAVAKFLGEGIASGDALIVIATEPHRLAFRRRLEGHGFDVARACDSGQMVVLDAHETLSRFMRGDEPDPRLFEREIGSLIARQGAKLPRTRRLRAFGEMVDVLWRDDRRNAAIRLEELWNDLQGRHPFTLLCAYASASFYKQAVDRHNVCRLHTGLVQNGADTNDGVPELRASPPLPADARRLAQEINQRRQVETALRASLRELRLKEEALRDSERQIQAITDALPVLVAYVDVDRRYRFASATYERWFGIPKAEILGKHVEDVLGTEAYRLIRPHVDRAFSGDLVTYEAELPYRGGGPRFIEATYVPQRGDDGVVRGIVALVADITDRKNLERGTAEIYRFAQAVVTAERLEQVFEAALDAIQGALGTKRAAILLFDNDGVMRFRAWRGLSDDYRKAVEGHSPWPRDAVAPQPVLVPDAQGDPTLGSYVPLFRREEIGSLAFIPLVTGDRLLGKFMVYHDRPHTYSSQEISISNTIANHLASVTARFAAVARLEETIHYNELFAGVLAHDLRNPLGAMMTAAQLALMRHEGEGDKDAKPLSRILTSGQRMTRMIDQLLDVTRVRVGGGIAIQPHQTNLADLCAQAVAELELVHPEWKVRCEVHGSQRGIWDPDRMLQAVSNLVANAGQHGDLNGGILLKLDGRHADFVTFEVHNQGTIPASLLPGLFDPFRGTQHNGRDRTRGLGLGLFIVNEIVRAHGGTVEVTSSDAIGTIFRVRLPRQTVARQ